MSVIFNQAITILRARKTGSIYSTEQVDDWDNPIAIPVPFPVSIQPRGSTEGGVERQQVTRRWALYTPPGRDLDLRASDRVRLSTGSVLMVNGAPLHWPHPWKPEAVHHVEADLEVVDG